MKRDFASLSAQEALHVAIFIEQRNGELYRQFADLFDSFGDHDSKEIGAVFVDMADEERMHGTMLQERYFERYGTQACVVTEDDVSDLVELPRLDDGSIFAIARAGAAANPRQHALAIALAAETGAQRFYAYLLEYTDDPELRGLYAELAEFEDDHVTLLRRKIEFFRHLNLAEEA